MEFVLSALGFNELVVCVEESIANALVTFALIEAVLASWVNNTSESFEIAIFVELAFIQLTVCIKEESSKTIRMGRILIKLAGECSNERVVVDLLVFSPNMFIRVRRFHPSVVVLLKQIVNLFAVVVFELIPFCQNIRVQLCISE